MKKYYRLLIVFVMVMSCFVNAQADSNAYINGPYEVWFKPGESRKIQLQLENYDEGVNTITWTAKYINNNCITLDSDGTITANDYGNANIIATLDNGNDAWITVKVSADPEEIVIEREKVYLNIQTGNPVWVYAYGKPREARECKLTYSTKDTSIAEVRDNGMVYPVSVGQTQMTVTAENGVCKSVDIVVRDGKYADDINCERYDYAIEPGEKIVLPYTLQPEGTSFEDETVVWSIRSNRDNAITLDETTGEVTGLQFGWASVTATISNGESTDISIHVEPKLEKIEFDETKNYVLTNEDMSDRGHLEFSVSKYLKKTPTSATHSTLKIESSNPGVIDFYSDTSLSGNIVGIGKTVITVTSESDPSITASHEFEVVEATEPTSIYAVSNPDITVYKNYSYATNGEPGNFVVGYEPTNAKQSTSWTLSDPEFATINSTNNPYIYLTFRKAGNTTVTATSNYNSDLTVPFLVTVLDGDPPAGTLSVKCNLSPIENGVVQWETYLAQDVTEYTFLKGTTFGLGFVIESDTCIPNVDYIQEVINNNPLLKVLPLGAAGDSGSSRLGMSVVLGVEATQTGTSTLKIGNDFTFIIHVVEGAWKQDANGWWYDNGDGTYPKNEFKDIDGKTYYFKNDGYMATEWVQVGEDRYYMGTDGAMVKSQTVGEYYVKEDGRMARNEEINDVYYGDDGKEVDTEVHEVTVTADFEEPHPGNILGFPANIKIPANVKYMTPEEYNETMSGQGVGDASGVIFFGTIDNRETRYTWEDQILESGMEFFYQYTVYAKEGYTFAEDVTAKFNEKEADQVKVSDDKKLMTLYVQYGPLSHTMTHVEAKAATCTEDGNVEYYECSVCEKKFADEEGTTEITTDVVLPKKGHTPEEELSSDSSYHFHKCEVCGEAVEETKEAHTWTEWEKDLSAGTQTRKCTVCGYTETKELPNGTWKQDSTGWWYDNGDGTYPKNEIKTIKGTDYYFNASGYMVTGWAQINGKWYVFDSSGAMKKNAWEGNYWLGADGVMITSNWVDNNQYYVGADGKWIPDYGVAKWKQDSTGWWYDNGDGTYPHGEFKTIDGTEYYFKENGYMATGWTLIDGKWYVFTSSGAMKKNAWEGNYYLKEDGTMAVSEWVDNGKYYVGADGAWIPDYGVAKWKQDANGWWYDNGDGTYPHGEIKTISGTEYYFKENGYMATGWTLIDGKWYVFDSSGAMKKNAWEGNYWLGADGVMATNSWVDRGNYYVGSDGIWTTSYYVASRNSDVFHRYNCVSVHNMNPSNIQYFDSREQAAANHRPCHNCNP